jgi:oligopeptide/dipeptide ABC transporter ATP-binding protein
MSAPLLELRSVTTELLVEGRLHPVIADVSFSIERGEIVGLVGESGSGKSVTARSILRLLPKGARSSGEIIVDGRNVLKLSRGELRALRAQRLAMVFQDPRAYADPLWKIGDYVGEGLRVHKKMPRQQVREQSLRLLADLGIVDPETVLAAYPSQLSGGMLQRVMIAGALSCDPEMIIADEPTTALDVTVQLEILAILDELRRERGLALLFITHDLGVASAICDRIIVMYSGRIMEMQRKDSLFETPLHPYSSALLSARPKIQEQVERLQTITGTPRSVLEVATGCLFAERCPFAEKACAESLPPLLEVEPGAFSACRRLADIRPSLRPAEMAGV